MKCEDCDKEFTLKPSTFYERNRKGIALKLCTDCLISGSNSPNWKGGHKHWSSGRYGKDKDGLSWKVQKRLAWKRDNEICQHCHEKKNRKPDVHHINPWMNSQSHALDNLICLCQKCHMTEEAKIQEKWGGELVTHPPKPAKISCVSCNKPYKIFKEERCRSCFRATQVNKAVELKTLGYSEKRISEELGVSMGSAHYYSTGCCSKRS